MYELVFWNYKEGIYLNHHLVYEAIAEEQLVDGLEELPITVIVTESILFFQNGNVWMRIVGKTIKGLVPFMFELPLKVLK